MTPRRLLSSAGGALLVLLVPVLASARALEVDLAQCPQGAQWQQQMEAAERARQAALPVVTQVRYPALQRDLLERVQSDQRVRAGDLSSPANVQAMAAEDARNLERLRIILAPGFPTPQQVGYDGVGAAWLLVQHADGDTALQRRMLEALSADPDRYGVRQDQLALLTDRVLLHEGHKQRYGTQFEQVAGGGWQPQPIEDPDGVDARRAQVGLMPMATYACFLALMYGATAAPAP